MLYELFIDFYSNFVKELIIILMFLKILGLFKIVGINDVIFIVYFDINF